MYRAAVIGCGKIGSELSVDPFLKGDVFTHAEAYMLCEKPLGMTLAESEMMATLAEKKNVVLATVYMRRYAKNFRALKKFLDDGGIGKLQVVTGIYIKGTFHNGTHWFDMLRYLCGEVDMVSGLNNLGETREDPTLD